MKTPVYRWTRQRLEALYRLYLEQGCGATAIARRLGPPATVAVVQRKIVADQLAAQRSEQDRQARRLAALDRAGEALRRGRADRGHVSWSSDMTATLERLYLVEGLASGEIAARMLLPALAVKRKIRHRKLAARRAALGLPRRRVHRALAGPTITRLPAGQARGVSGWETMLRVAPAPETAVEAARRTRAQAASRRTSQLRQTANSQARSLLRAERRQLAAPDAGLSI